MAITEVFPNPTVKQVIFQIRFPNLFYLPSLIGNFQIQIMKDYPESVQLLKKSFVITSESDQEKLAQLATEAKDDVRQIWQFKSKSGVVVNVTTESLSLQSESHKSYRLGDLRFRDAIDSVCGKFLEITKLPLLNRVGLRYIDDCPVPESLDQFPHFYNSTFPTSRFPLDATDVSQFTTLASRGPYKLRYVESFQKAEDGKKSFTLDFDASSTDLATERLMETTDQLHDLISEEYEKTIKEPVYQHMRRNGTSHAS